MQKKGYCKKEVQVQGHISLFLVFCHESFCQVYIDSITSVFPFAGRLTVGKKHVAFTISPPVISAGCHEERCKFSTQRGKLLGSLRPPSTEELLESRISANAFVISFFPSVIHPVGQQPVPHFETSNKQRAMQYWNGDSIRVYLVYVCVCRCSSFVLLVYSFIYIYILIVYCGVAENTKLITIIIIATIIDSLLQYYVKHFTYIL